MSITGKFGWYDLMTTDGPAAQDFYRGVMGWEMRDAGLSDRSYTVLSAGKTGIGGLMAWPPEAFKSGAKPGWIGYILVPDVDDYATRVTQAGGSIHRAAEDIPGVGRFAVVADPHGAAFILFKGAMDQQPQQPPPGTPGHVGWHELRAGDGPSAFEFYSGLFGWTKDAAIDMGAMGVYQLFATGGEAVGGMMTKMESMPVPYWLYYFNVDGIDGAIDRVKAHGGQIVHGPMQVPGGNWVVQCLDPQGAFFALVSMRR